jgi:hypothetical protein
MAVQFHIRVRSLLHAQPKIYRRISPGHFDGNPRRPKHGAGRNASTVCNRRYAARRFDFHLRRGGIRAWGPSHHVTEVQAQDHTMSHSLVNA